MRFGVLQNISWRHRVIGAWLTTPLYFLLYFLNILPLGGFGLWVLGFLTAAYTLALTTKDGRNPLAWPLFFGEALMLAVFMRETGGAQSPFQVLAYPWMFGSALTLLLNESNKIVVPFITLLTALSLLVGAWGSDGFPLFLAINFIALSSMTLATAMLNLERNIARSDTLLPMVLNRSAGIEKLESWVRNKETFNLAFIDLGAFKQINDRHGHHVGDEVLRAVAERLRNAVRSSDAVIRYGGDEFVVATRGANPSERLEQLFMQPVTTSAGPIKVQADIGNVPYNTGDNLEVLLRRADALMYERKNSRREKLTVVGLQKPHYTQS
jgi:diguanylate cyclase (GGDEF)-like protein